MFFKFVKRQNFGRISNQEILASKDFSHDATCVLDQLLWFLLLFYFNYTNQLTCTDIRIRLQINLH